MAKEAEKKKKAKHADCLAVHKKVLASNLGVHGVEKQINEMV